MSVLKRLCTPVNIALSAFFLLAVMNGSIKKVRETIPFLEVVTLRCLISFTVLSFWLGWHKVKEAFVVSYSFKWWHLLRVALGMSAMLCLVFVAPFMPLADYTALSFTNPLILACLARLILKEHIPKIRWLAIALGFIGVLLVAQPSGVSGVRWAAIVLLCGCVLAASSDIVMKRLVARQPSSHIVLMLFGLSSVLLLPTLPFVWKTPNLNEWLLILTLGVTGGLFQLAFSKAFELMPASMVAPYVYSALLWTTLLGWLFWKDLPNFQGIIGTLFIITDGLLVYFSTRRALSKKSIHADALPKQPELTSASTGKTS